MGRRVDHTRLTNFDLVATLNMDYDQALGGDELHKLLWWLVGWLEKAIGSLKGQPPSPWIVPFIVPTSL